MKKIRILLIACFITNFLIGCTTLKEGFKSQRKNSTDEFLVEKKQPLVLPPDFNNLPIPDQGTIDNNDSGTQIENIITKDKEKSQNNNLNTDSISNQSTENFILKKIKN